MIGNINPANKLANRLPLNHAIDMAVGGFRTRPYRLQHGITTTLDGLY